METYHCQWKAEKFGHLLALRQRSIKIFEKSFYYAYAYHNARISSFVFCVSFSDLWLLLTHSQPRLKVRFNLEVEFFDTPHLLCIGASAFAHPKNRADLVVFYDMPAVLMTYSNPDSHRTSCLQANTMFVCFWFFVLLENFSFIWRRHHYWRRAYKFWPILGTHGYWAVKGLYCEKPTVTRANSLLKSSPRTRDSHPCCRTVYKCPVPSILIRKEIKQNESIDLLKTHLNVHVPMDIHQSTGYLL